MLSCFARHGPFFHIALQRVCSVVVVLLVLQQFASSQTGSRTVYKTSEELTANIAKWVEPTFPAIAKAAHAGGRVVIELTIDEQGIVADARIVEGHPLLHAAMLHAARQWKFNPFVSKGIPIRVIGRIIYNFPDLETEYHTIVQLERQVKRYPRSARSHYRLAVAYVDGLRYEDALAQLVAAISLNPRFTDAYMKLGHVYGRLFMFEKAYEAYTQAVRLAPQSSEAMYGRGQTLIARGRYAEAIADLKKSLELDEPITNSYFLIGKCYVLLGSPLEAVSIYKTGLERHDSDLGHFGLGEAYLELQLFPSAIDEFKRALDLNEGQGQAAIRYLLGRAYLGSGDHKQAMEQYEILKKRDETLAIRLLEEIKQKDIEQGRSKG